MFLKSSSVDEKKAKQQTASVRINSQKNDEQGNFLRSLMNSDKKSSRKIQAATISGSKVPQGHLASSELQLNHIDDENYLNSSTTFNPGSTMCVNSSSKGIANGTADSKQSLFSSTKRKRGSLFNLFSFQKPNVVSNSKHEQNRTSKIIICNDENSEPIANSGKNGLPPPPPEFADRVNSERKKNGSSSKSKSSNENTLKNSHKSIFSALRRKSVKSASLDIDYKTPEQHDKQIETDSSNRNSIIENRRNTTPTMPSIKDNNSNNNNNINSDVSDAESTISNLFSFDHYISDNVGNNKNNNNDSSPKENLKYANEYIFEDESAHLADISCDMIVLKEHIKNTCDNKQQVNRSFKKKNTFFIYLHEISLNSNACRDGAIKKTFSFY